MADTIFTWFLIALMALLAIASVKIIISFCHQVYNKFHTIFGEESGSLTNLLKHS